MKFWLPYTIGHSGSDISIEALANALEDLGCAAVAQAFPHWMQYMPWLLNRYRAPAGTDLVIGNSWNAFAFRRAGAPLMTVERLFVLDPELARYRSPAQSIFHRTIVRHGLRRSYATSHRVIALSNASARSITRVFPSVNPMVIRSAVDLEFFRPGPPRAPLAERRVRLLFVGNLSRRKGADLLAPILDALGERFALDCLCGRDGRGEVSGHPRIKLHARQSLSAVRTAYQVADLVLMPTRLEGLPRVAMEAIACATPVVSSDASSLPEVVVDDVTGLTCARDNVPAFAKAIRAITTDQQRWDRISAQCRPFAEAHHDLRHMAAKYVAEAEAIRAERSA